jgi:hypothetical protein
MLGSWQLKNRHHNGRRTSCNTYCFCKENRSAQVVLLTPSSRFLPQSCIFFCQRERNGVTEYKVFFHNKRFSKWLDRTRFDSPVMFEAYDESLAGQEILKEHERQKTKNQKIVQQR